MDKEDSMYLLAAALGLLTAWIILGPLFLDAFGLAPADRFCQTKGYDQGYFLPKDNEIYCYTRVPTTICFDEEKTICKIEIEHDSKYFRSSEEKQK